RGQLCTLTKDVFMFFFSSRRRHTRSKRDWSSDVCSSDLLGMFLKECIGAIIQEIIHLVAVVWGFLSPKNWWKKTTDEFGLKAFRGKKRLLVFPSPNTVIRVFKKQLRNG